MMYYWGRRSKRAAIITVAVSLIFLTTISGILPVLPELLNSFFPSSVAKAPSITGPSRGSPILTSSGPGISLPPGIIGYGSESSPSYSQFISGAISPKLVASPSAFVYQTSYGIYSFNRSSPFTFSLRSQSGGLLAKKSFFFVTASGALLTPGASNVTVSTDNQFATRYEALSNGTVVGHLLLQVKFYASSTPKMTISFSKTPAWALGNFNIAWATFTIAQWAKPTGQPASDISTMQTARQISNASRVDVGLSGDPAIWTEWLTTDWSDASGGSLEEGIISLTGFTDRGVAIVFGTNQATIDPTQVATSNVNSATAYSTQRKVAYYQGKYYAFFYSGLDIVWVSSIDQVAWSDTFVAGGGTGFGGSIAYSFDFFQSGATVAIDWLYYNSTAGGDHTTSLYFRTGTIFAGDISWRDPVQVAHWPQPYSWPPSVAIGSDGTFWAAGIWQDSNSHYNIWTYKSADGSKFSLSTQYLTSDSGATRYEALQLEPLPQGKLMALSSHYTDTGVRWTVWNPLSSGGPSWSSIQSFNLYLPANTYKWNLISATSTSDGYVHVLTVSPTAYSYYNSTSGGWTYSTTLYSGYGLYPTISADTLGNLYAFWLATPQAGNAIWYQVKPQGQSWLQALQIFGSGQPENNATWLNAARLSSKQAIIAWTVSTPSPYAIYFGSIPLPSGIASGPPSRPWSSLGLTPYEQYFTQNGEYVSPGNGLLAVSQTDISVQGRNGLSLSIGRVYVQPFTQFSMIPINYEASPYAYLGNGWQLNLPWVGTQFLHILNGEEFPIVWTSYNATSNTWTMENHQTEDFVFTKTSSSYQLTMKDGTVYNFLTNGKLNTIVDRTGQNQISLSYGTNNYLSTVTDSIGRNAVLKYDSNNLLTNVTYGGQTVKYGISGGNPNADLATVTDAVGRVTSFKYSLTNNYLLTGIVYPAGGNSTYTFGSVTIGTDLVNYYVTLQTVYNPGQVVKSSSFSYNITDGEVMSMSVKQSDGFTVQGYTNYLFNTKSNSLTRTVLNSTQVQMLKTQFWYDPITGRSVQQDIYSGTSISRSFYNSQFFDLWGNIIYTRDNTGHEAYQSFANNNRQ